MPTASAGVKPRSGKKNPVTLVATVVTRKNAVHPGNSFAANSPETTPKPEAIPAKLIKMWTRVKYSNAISYPRS